MTAPFTDRLAAAVRDRGSALVVGLDPDLERFPTAIRRAAEREASDSRSQAAAALLAFNTGVLEAIAPFACAVKPQIAFYEAWGPPGLEAYEATITRARDHGLLVIGDVKRGDIGSTARAYARAHLQGPAPADAITVNPYLGTDGMQPFLDAVDDEGAGLFVLVRTSNPSAAELQDLPVGDRPFHTHVAELVTRWGAGSIGDCGYSSVGAVVGATAPRELARLRKAMPRSWFLIPGVGAQGGTAADVAPAFDEAGLGAVINASRSILYAYDDPGTADWQGPVAEAARSLRDALAEAAGSPGAVSRPGA